MLYEFSSRATGRVIMTVSVAEHLLALMGRSPAPEGVIVVDDLALALERLKGAVERSAPQPVDPTPDPFEEDDPRTRPVGLGQRAWPLIDLMTRALNARRDVLWEVT